MQRKSPLLSVVLLTPDTFRSIQKTVRHLHEQTVREQLEVIVAAPEATLADLPSEAVQRFNRFEIVEVGPIHSTGTARAEAVRYATAPVVALAEDHCFPEPDWAERIIEAHREDWVAVGPVLSNANPDSALSWAHLCIEYGPWLHAEEPLDAEHLPGHNSSYKREVLLTYGDRLSKMLDAESVMHWDLRSRGHRLLLDPSINTNHLNFSRLGTSFLLRFYGGRLFGAARAREWSLWKRAAYFIASPMIPLIRLRRSIRYLWAMPGQRRRWPKVVPAMFLMLLVDGVGEAWGYLAGVGQSLPKLTALEFHRDRNLRDEEKHLAFE